MRKTLFGTLLVVAFAVAAAVAAEYARVMIIGQPHLFDVIGTALIAMVVTPARDGPLLETLPQGLPSRVCCETAMCRSHQTWTSTSCAQTH